MPVLLQAHAQKVSSFQLLGRYVRGRLHAAVGVRDLFYLVPSHSLLLSLLCVGEVNRSFFSSTDAAQHTKAQSCEFSPREADVKQLLGPRPTFLIGFIFQAGSLIPHVSHHSTQPRSAGAHLGAYGRGKGVVSVTNGSVSLCSLKVSS